VVQKAWSFFEGHFSYDSSLVSQKSIQSLVDEVVMLMQYLVDTTLVLEGDASLDHVLLHPIQLMVKEVVDMMQVQ
jgi:hypothetical protein